jgi:hypothetical protein
MAVNVAAQGAEGDIWAYERGSVSRVLEIE